MAQEIAHERLFLQRDGFLKREVPIHKAVHAAAAVRDVLFDAFFKRQNRGGGLLVIHRDTLATKPYDTTLWMRLKNITVRREGWKNRAAGPTFSLPSVGRVE
jgi:predicted methyltransferase